MGCEKMKTPELVRFVTDKEQREAMGRGAQINGKELSFGKERNSRRINNNGV